MNILINGVGNIGSTVLSILSDFKEVLGIRNLYALKNSLVNPWNEVEIEFLKQKGIIFYSQVNNSMSSIEDIIHEVDYIIDCNTNSIGNKNKPWYDSLPHLKGASAQGSEKGFGISYMSGINDDIISREKYAHIVSCNTHSIAKIIDCLTSGKPEQLTEGDFVVVRRSEDIGQHERLVTANVISRHQNETYGTHHATDVNDLYLTQDIKLNIQSSDITTPSQLLHSVRFNLKFRDEISLNTIKNNFSDDEYVSTTQKYDSNVVFELGRRYSPYGRIYSQVIINENNLLIDKNSNSIKGWAFIPQEGSTILSTIKAMLLQLNIPDAETKFARITEDLIRKVW